MKFKRGDLMYIIIGSVKPALCIVLERGIDRNTRRRVHYKVYMIKKQRTTHIDECYLYSINPQEAESEV